MNTDRIKARAKGTVYPADLAARAVQRLATDDQREVQNARRRSKRRLHSKTIGPATDEGGGNRPRHRPDANQAERGDTLGGASRATAPPSMQNAERVVQGFTMPTPVWGKETQFQLPETQFQLPARSGVRPVVLRRLG